MLQIATADSILFYQILLQIETADSTCIYFTKLYYKLQGLTVSMLAKLLLKSYKSYSKGEGRIPFEFA